MNKKKLAEIQYKEQEDLNKANLNRARSVTVGTCFGGTTELMMRGNDGSVLWCPMQPVEVVELIHQLSANIGCHLSLKPRNDFASWRNWKVNENDLLSFSSHPAFANTISSYNQVGANLPAPEQQPGLQPNLMSKGQTHEDVAIKTNNE